MSFFALIAALLLEQFHPLVSRRYLFSWLSHYVQFFQQQFNAGEQRHGKIAWLLAVIPLTMLTVFLFWVLHRAHPVFAWAFDVLVLYMTMGFRQFSHYFREIYTWLRGGDVNEARRLLSTWTGMAAHELNTEEVARVTIEQALLASHRNVFGVIVWFVLFSVLGLGGAAGALLYRLGQFLGDHWGDAPTGELGAFGAFARRADYFLEWLPIRLVALTFAIVGDFENTVYCWRSQAAQWADPEAGILLASGAGSLGVRLGMPIPQEGMLIDRAELGSGEEADADFMQSAVGLVWRSVIFWLLLLAMLTLTNFLS